MGTGMSSRQMDIGARPWNDKAQFKLALSYYYTTHAQLS
jgi:hypothetical protein